MARFELSAHAHGDLRSIAAYTETTWGETQRDSYLDMLEACMDKLAERPLLGASKAMLGEGMRAYPAGSHVVFYVEADFGIVIVRILHRRQDPPRHLPGAPSDD